MIKIRKFWDAVFRGCLVGSLGHAEHRTAVVEGDTEEQAKLRLYDRFEHLSAVMLTPKTEFTEVIDGFTVALNTDTDGEGSTECWVTKGRGSCSLEAAEQGYLDTVDWLEQPKISSDQLTKIRRWADERGYGGDTHLQES